MRAYYNEIDPYAAQWLRNLIAAGHISPGDVDERSITDVRADDLRGYGQCHFFAGIGGWSYALRLAGWPDDRPVWTGSCPCQPFSAAGKQRGSDDERHLWPAFFDLIRERSPASVFGEQVAGAAGLAWLDHVFADLEGAGYAAAAANLCAAGVGAPHIRQRLYWVAHNEREGRPWGQTATRAHGLATLERGSDGLVAHADGWHPSAERLQRSRQHGQQPQDGGTGFVADRESDGWRKGSQDTAGRDARDGAARQGRLGLADNGNAGLLGDAADVRRAQPGDAGAVPGEADSEPEHGQQGSAFGPFGAGSIDAWRELEWIECSDGKARPTEPGLFPLAHGIPNRVGRLRAYGNAIVPQVAAVFVMAAKTHTEAARERRAA
jgi:DNA (cytosine-5)-methyltransferase 1